MAVEGTRHYRPVSNINMRVRSGDRGNNVHQSVPFLLHAQGAFPDQSKGLQSPEPSPLPGIRYLSYPGRNSRQRNGPEPYEFLQPNNRRLPTQDVSDRETRTKRTSTGPYRKRKQSGISRVSLRRKPHMPWRHHKEYTGQTLQCRLPRQHADN